MRNFILLSGKNNLNNDYTIERYIISQVKPNPKILFIPAASLDSKRVIDNFYNQYNNFNVEINVLYLTKNVCIEEIKIEVAKSDILYFSGGNTKNLVNYLKMSGFDKLLQQIDNKLIVGVSAGANMISKYGMGDSDAYFDNFHYYNYKMVEGLGLLDITFCPHYQNDDLIYYNDIVGKYPYDGYAIYDDTAIHFCGDDIKVIKSIKSNSVYKFERKENYLMKPLYENTKKIAVLGPKGTFSEVACNKFLENNTDKYDIMFYQSIAKTAESLKENDLAILPFENTLDGYVLETIDILIKNDFDIICDVKTKVEFAFVTNAKRISDVKNIFVQFKTRGQCQDFLSSNDYKLIITESNIESLDNLNSRDDTYGAIIPIHKIKDVKFKTVIKNVEDKDSNYTRFIVVSNKKEIKIYHDQIKCSLCIYLNEERPGLLYELLKIFSDNSLNMVSIMSRPTKEELGKYNFYIELMVPSSLEKIINKVINDLSNSIVYRVKNLGIYSSID